MDNWRTGGASRAVQPDKDLHFSFYFCHAPISGHTVLSQLNPPSRRSVNRYSFRVAQWRSQKFIFFWEFGRVRAVR